jgi:hypothetical protein
MSASFPCDGITPSDRRHGSARHVAKAGRGSAHAFIFHSDTRNYDCVTRSCVVFESTDMAEPAASAPDALELDYIQYDPAYEQRHLPAIRQLISKDLSEPYSIYVYRYFLYQWGDLCYMVLHSLPYLFEATVVTRIYNRGD